MKSKGMWSMGILSESPSGMKPSRCSQIEAIAVVISVRLSCNSEESRPCLKTNRLRNVATWPCAILYRCHMRSREK
jgi:hypothetical protein